jgi:hypothetical protein
MLRFSRSPPAQPIKRLRPTSGRARYQFVNNSPQLCPLEGSSATRACPALSSGGSSASVRTVSLIAQTAGADTAVGIGRTHLCLACTSHSAMSCFISLSSLSPILPSTDPHPQTPPVACASLPSVRENAVCVQRCDDVTPPVRLPPSSSFFPFLFARMGGGAHGRCGYVSPLALVPLVFRGW